MPIADGIRYRVGPHGGTVRGRNFHGRNVSWDFDWSGYDEVQDELERLEREFPDVAYAIVTEAGLLMEFHGKRLIRVFTGRLRASWGHYTPELLTPRATPAIAADARRSSVFIVPRRRRGRVFQVTVGTRVRYAPHVNYRLGDYFVERAHALTAAALPAIVRTYVGRLRDGRVGHVPDVR